MLLLYLMLEGHTCRTVLLSALCSNKDINHLEEIQSSKENNQGARKLAELQKC